MNWIAKVKELKEAIKHLSGGKPTEFQWAQLGRLCKGHLPDILSHAPVIDAEKLGQKMADLFEETEHNLGYGMRSDIKEGFAVRAAQLITDSIDLKNDKE